MNRRSISVFYLSCLLILTMSYVRAQGPIKKYNETLRITEYYNQEGTMTGFSRINKMRKTIDFYDAKGKLLKRERIEDDSIRVEIKKKAFPKSQLTKEELAQVGEWQYEEIEGKRLIKESNPDLEIIGYYNLEGTLVGYNKYHRGTEEWYFHWLNKHEQMSK